MPEGVRELVNRATRVDLVRGAWLLEHGHVERVVHLWIAIASAAVAVTTLQAAAQSGADVDL